MNTNRPYLCILAGLVLLAAAPGCRNPVAKKEPPPPPDYLTAEPKQTAELSEKEYLMRRATLGSRSERLEALDVIDRTNDREFIPFLVERLQKEDDAFLQIRVMKALARSQDVRAVRPLREIAVQRTSRVSAEAVYTLYQLNDDNYVPKLIGAMRYKDENPESSRLAYRTMRRIYGIDLPDNARTWNTYFHTHRLTPYQDQRWYARIRPAEPPAVEGTTQVAPRPESSRELPNEYVRSRKHIGSFFDFWKPDTQ